MSIRQWLLRRLLPPRPEQLSAPTDAEAADLIDRTLAWQGMGRQAAPISCDEALALLTAYREAREDAALAAERDDHPMIVAKIVDGPVTPEAGRNIADAIARMKLGDAIVRGPELELSILGRDSRPGVHWIPARMSRWVWAFALAPFLAMIPPALGVEPRESLSRAELFRAACLAGGMSAMAVLAYARLAFRGACKRQDNRPPMPVAKDGEPLFASDPTTANVCACGRANDPDCAIRVSCARMRDRERRMAEALARDGHRGNMVPPVKPALRLRLTRGDTVIADHVIADGVLKCERRVDCAIYTVPVDDGTRHAYECALHWGGPYATDPTTQTLTQDREHPRVGRVVPPESCKIEARVRSGHPVGAPDCPCFECERQYLTRDAELGKFHSAEISKLRKYLEREHGLGVVEDPIATAISLLILGREQAYKIGEQEYLARMYDVCPRCGVTGEAREEMGEGPIGAEWHMVWDAASFRECPDIDLAAVVRDFEIAREQGHNPPVVAHAPGGYDAPPPMGVVVGLRHHGTKLYARLGALSARPLIGSDWCAVLTQYPARLVSVFPGEHPRKSREPEAVMLPPGYVATGERLCDIPVVGAHSLASQWCMAYVDAENRFTLTRCAVAQLRATSESPKLWDLVMVRYEPACMGCGSKSCTCALDDPEWSVDITVNGVPLVTGVQVDRPKGDIGFQMYADGRMTLLGTIYR